MATRTTVSQQTFLDSEEGLAARRTLQAMEDDPAFNTQDSYIAHDSGSISFTDKHMIYLCEHPKLETHHYLANLRLMTRIKKR